MLNPTCTRENLVSELKGSLSVATRLLSLLHATGEIERMGTDACHRTFRTLIVFYKAFICHSWLSRTQTHTSIRRIDMPHQILYTDMREDGEIELQLAQERLSDR